MDKEIVITSAVRTAIGKFEGGFKNTPAVKLGSLVIEEALRRSKLQAELVDEVILGNVVSAGLGQNPARQAAIYAGIPVEAGALTVNKVCGSGLKSVMIAASEIIAGDMEIVVAGGMENMTMGPYILDKARAGYRLGNNTLIDAMVNDGLWDIYNNFHMGMTGEIIAEKYGITREEADKFSYNSHMKAFKATENGEFKDEILPVEIPQRKGDPLVVDKDEGVRGDTSVEKLAKLRPVFKKDGLITAGNASQISDGAGATVVMSHEKAKELGITPLVKIVDFATGGVKPEDVMYAPVPTLKKLFNKTGFKPEDIDLYEHNEAFSTASVAIQREFNIPDDKFNVHGGAVALGHPIGASGARVLVTLLYAMKQRNAHRGLATLCLGGGNAVAMIVEQLE
ncbi:acetyl-CoA C-acetyltransferase [[Eubacterium] cellulosolvens]